MVKEYQRLIRAMATFSADIDIQQAKGDHEFHHTGNHLGTTRPCFAGKTTHHHQSNIV